MKKENAQLRAQSIPMHRQYSIKVLIIHTVRLHWQALSLISAHR